MGKEDFQDNGIDKELDSLDDVSYEQAIEKYLDDAEQSKVLRPNQREVFADLQRFFQQNLKRGFIDGPTGTGKTVIFVELSKALNNARIQGRKPKILVVTTFKDLVHQTMGKTGKKGYGKFAPDLKVGSYFSDTPASQKRSAALDTYDVIVTTYHSFKILNRTIDAAPAAEDEALIERAMESEEFREFVLKNSYSYAVAMLRLYYSERRTLLDKFDVIILDEAHHSFGVDTENLIKSLSDEKVVIGFTATPEADLDTHLDNILINRIHSLTLKEAIWMDLLSPIVPIAVSSGVKVEGSNLYDETGEYIDNKLQSLSHNPRRNSLVIKAVKTLVNAGVGTIVSCMAGGEAWQARHIAAELRAQGIRAAAVYAAISSRERMEIYRKFEAGEIDVLTYIGVLGEGWDSARAKGLVNARPTRSKIVSKQRVGRITRPGGLAFAVDILDEYDEKNPPINVAEVVNDGDVPFGRIIGEVEDTALYDTVMNDFRENLPMIPTLIDNYTQYDELLRGLDTLYRGRVPDSYDRNKFYSISSIISTAYQGMTDEIIEKMENLSGFSIAKKFAKRGRSILTVYKQEHASRLLYKLPETNPENFWTDEEGARRISIPGLVKLFSNRFPKVTEEIMTDLLDDIQIEMSNQPEADKFWTPIRYQYIGGTNRKYKVYKMFQYSQSLVERVNQDLKKYFAELES